MFLKLFSAFFRLYILRSTVPISVNISVTDRCNFSCTHCNIPKRQSKELATKEIFTIVDALDKAGTMKISLCGGEPLMRQDIGQIIDYIKSKKIMADIVTNGALVRQKIDEIKNVDVQGTGQATNKETTRPARTAPLLRFFGNSGSP